MNREQYISEAVSLYRRERSDRLASEAQLEPSPANSALTNKRRLALQMLDGEARVWLRRALWADVDALAGEQSKAAREKALARIVGRETVVSGPWGAAQQERRRTAILGLLEAIG